MLKIFVVLFTDIDTVGLICRRYLWCNTVIRLVISFLWYFVDIVRVTVFFEKSGRKNGKSSSKKSQLWGKYSK